MKILNDYVKVIGIEASAGCMLLLANAENKKRECVTVHFDWGNGPAYPMSKLMLIDQATGYNAFEGFGTEEESKRIKNILTQRLSDEHIDELNTLLATRELLEYISFEGAALIKYPADHFNRNQINAQYVIERYILPDHRYVYKVLNGNCEESDIKIGRWSITNIQPAAHKDKALYFDLIDPEGKSSADKSIPYHWVIEGAESGLFSVATNNDDTGLSDMMGLALEVFQVCQCSRLY